MADVLTLLRENRIDELWQRCCGFIDLNIDQFMEIQNQLLLEQIQLLNRCELGEKIMRGAKPQSVEEFRKQVPLTTYDDYIPYLSDKMEDALPEKARLWQRTSGRSSKHYCKWVPVTERMYRELGELQLGISLLASCRERGDITIREHDKALYGLAPPPYASGCWARRVAEEGIFDIMPDIDEAESMEFQQRIEEGFKMGMSQGIDVMFAIGSVLVAIGERLGQGGSLKRITSMLNRPGLLFKLSKAALKSRLAGRPMLPKDLWSLKALISSGTDSNIYREKIREMWGRYPLDAYGVTEGVVIATQAWDYKDMTFIPNINYLEFIPEAEYWKWLQESNYQPNILALDEVLPEQRYIMVITNFLGGAYVRYVLDDIIVITSLRNENLNINIPQMSFYGRAGDVIEFGLISKYARQQPADASDGKPLVPFGEEFAHVFFTEKIMWQAIEGSGFEYKDWVVRKDVEDDKALLHIYIEPKATNHYDEENLTKSLHEQLKLVNDDYVDLEIFLGYRPLRVTLLPMGAFDEYTSQRRAAGADLAHLKPPHMNASDTAMEALKAPQAVQSASVSETANRPAS